MSIVGVLNEYMVMGFGNLNFTIHAWGCNVRLEKNYTRATVATTRRGAAADRVAELTQGRGWGLAMLARDG